MLPATIAVVIIFCMIFRRRCTCHLYRELDGMD
jgi:hypothetical protein